MNAPINRKQFLVKSSKITFGTALGCSLFREAAFADLISSAITESTTTLTSSGPHDCGWDLVEMNSCSEIFVNGNRVANACDVVFRITLKNESDHACSAQVIVNTTAAPQGNPPVATQINTVSHSLSVPAHTAILVVFVMRVQSVAPGPGDIWAGGLGLPANNYSVNWWCD